MAHAVCKTVPEELWGPGAHVDLHLGPDLVRQYSLCGDPAERDQWRIAVLLEQDSRGGSERVHALRAGESLRVRACPADQQPGQQVPALLRPGE